MKCPNCGLANPVKVKFCGSCGKALPTEATEPPEVGNRQCVECGRSIGWDAIACMYCGHDYRKRTKPGTEGYLVTGAVLTILSGVLGLMLLTVILEAAHDVDSSGAAIMAISYVCSGLGVVGGVSALMRKWFTLAVLGGACAILTPAFFFAIPGLALIVRSATSFQEDGIKT